MLSQAIEFSSSHPVLSMSFVSLLGFILFYEFRAFTQKFVAIGPAAAIALINNDEAKTVLLDVREMNELNEGMINDALHIPLSNLQGRLTELDKYKNDSVLVYCRSGNRSGSVCRTLTGRGFEKVYNLAGGIMAWQDAHLPVSKNRKKKKHG
jgi:rhodanese-related sulfurtransferase